MPSLRLTRRAIDDIPFSASGQILYRHTLLSGFGLRVGSRSKVYFAEGQVNRDTRRVTIGRADLFAPEVARKKALALLGEMAEGRNPNEEKRKETVERVTLAVAFERFFEARNKLSPHTVSNYGRTAKLYLKAWRKKPMSQITRQMVLAKHQEIAKAHGEVTANNAMRHLRSVNNFIAATQDDFPPNPVLILSQARAWYRERRRQTLVTALDLPMWWKAVMAEPDYSRDFLLTALFTGMRRGERMKLRWDNVDLLADLAPALHQERRPAEPAAVGVPGGPADQARGSVGRLALRTPRPRQERSPRGDQKVPIIVGTDGRTPSLALRRISLARRNSRLFERSI